MYNISPEQRSGQFGELNNNSNHKWLGLGISASSIDNGPDWENGQGSTAKDDGDLAGKVY